VTMGHVDGVKKRSKGKIVDMGSGLGLSSASLCQVRLEKGFAAAFALQGSGSQ